MEHTAEERELDALVDGMSENAWQIFDTARRSPMFRVAKDAAAKAGDTTADAIMRHVRIEGDIKAARDMELVSGHVTDVEKQSVIRALALTIVLESDIDDGYVLQPSEEKGWWVLTDTANGLVCRFREGDFNGTQKYTLLDDVERPDPVALAGLAAELGQWLADNYPQLAFN